MGDFQKALAVVLQREGGYSSNPDDRGGETFCGISRNRNSYWAGWSYVDIEKSRGQTPKADDPRFADLIAAFYHANFWLPISGSALPDPIAGELFDTAVNMGVAAAGKILQEALNLLNRNGAAWPEVAEDGQIGPATLATVKTASDRGDARILYNLLNVIQADRYLTICRGDRSQEKFLRGWLGRVEIVKT